MMKIVRGCCLSLLILGFIFVSLVFSPSACAANEITIIAPDEWELFSWDDAITLKWRAFSGAAGYYVSIRNVSTNALVLQNQWTTGTSMKISNYLPDEKGEYKLWVGASDSASSMNILASSTIYIYVAHEPDITNGSASAVTDSGATLQMTIDLDYGYSISDHGFYIGTSSAKSAMTRYSLGATGKGTKTLKVSDLEAGTKYYYRAYAVNDVGEEYTTAKSFTTLSNEITITAPNEWELFSWDDAITMKWRAASGAAGYYVSIRNVSTNALVLQNQWTTGTSLNVSNYLPKEKGEYKLWVGATDSASSTSIFASGTIYIYVAHEPSVTNGSASAVTDSGAALQMTIDLDYGYSISDHGFYLGTSSDTSKMTRYSLGSTEKGTKTMQASNLMPGTEYYYRAYAVNDVGEACTAAKSFTTLSDTYVVSYHANGGSNVPVSQIKEKDIPLTLTTLVPTRDGYTFLGWAVSPNADLPQYSSGAIYNENADLLLYAVWKREHTLTDASVMLPKGLTAIEQEAFINAAFSSVAIPDGTLSIGARAFAYCRKLVRIDIPATVRFISDSAFTGSTNVTIYGISGSYAESYADLYNLPFISIGTSPTPTPDVTVLPTVTPAPSYNPLPDPDPTVTGGGGDSPLPASEPTVSNSVTKQTYRSQEIAEYNRSLGGFQLNFQSANASRYHVTAIVLNETPLFGASEEASNQKTSAQMVKILYDDDTAKTSLPFQLSDLQLGSYLKIAVGAYSSGNTTNTADAWLVFGLKLVSNQSGNLPSGDKLNFASAIWSELKSWGFNDIQAAGIMGNIRAESAFCPYNAQNDYGYPGVDNRSDYVFKVDDEVGFGLCQWTVSSRKQRLLNHAGSGSVWSFDVQMSFLHWELQNMRIGNTSFENYLKGLTTLKEVAELFMTDFEAPKNQSSAAKQLRVRYAQEAYEAYASQTVQFSMTHSQLSGNTLTLSPAATAGDFSTLSVTSNVSWTAALSDNQFVKFVAAEADSATIHNAASASGAAGSTSKLRLQIVKTPNPGASSSATMTVRAGGEIRTYTITQTIPGSSSEAAPTLSLSLPAETVTVSNSGRGCIRIHFTAANADSFSFEFKGLTAEEAYDRNYSTQKQGFKSSWNFGLADFATNGNSYNSTTSTCYFYIAANTAPGTYTVTMTVSGKGGSVSAPMSFKVMAPYVPKSSLIHLAWKSAEYEISPFYEELCQVNVSDPCERFIAVAESQQGYHEGNAPASNEYCNFSELNGKNINGGENFTEYLYAYKTNTRLQAEYEKLTPPSISTETEAEWCAYFVSWCARAAGISTSVLPNSAGAGPAPAAFNLPGIGAAQYKGLSIEAFNNLKASRSYTWKSYADGHAKPKRGDLLFLGPKPKAQHDSYEAAKAAKDSSTSHVAIITGITENADGTITIKTIEGNLSDKVTTATRKVDKKTGAVKNSTSYVIFWGAIYWK